jgi:hypothetical protein
MKRKFLAFDVETASVLTEAQFQDWKRHRPLGVTCIASWASDAAAPKLWDARQPGSTASRMSAAQLVEFVNYLDQMAAQGYTLLTWNGLGFDWDVVAEESGRREICRRLAFDHVDMMFHVFCTRGHPVGLDKAAMGLGIAGKPPGMSGVHAPQMWAEGRFEEVLEYVTHDVRITLEVARKCEQYSSFRWLTSRGSVSSMPLPQGWLTVKAARELGLPDTSWMSSPIPRSRFTEWIDAT